VDKLKIPLMKPQLATVDKIIPFLRSLDQNNIYSNNGPLVKKLEDAYSDYFKVNRDLVVAASNASQAIQGLVSISEKKNWLVPDYTFVATGLAVLNANKNIVLCDVNLHDWKIDLSQNLVTSDKYGVIPVMPFGAEVVFEPYSDFVDVIIDAAASLGSDQPDFSEMPSTWSVVYSLHATKVLGAGEGSIVVCGSQDIAKKLRAWINFGFNGERSSEIQGTNAKLSEVNAAYGLYSILNIDSEKNDWLMVQEVVSQSTAGRRWNTRVNIVAQFHPYWIAQFSDEFEVSSVVKTLNSKGIESRKWWPKPLSAQKPFIGREKIAETLNSKFLASTQLGLPMYRGIPVGAILEICRLVDESIN
jgi:dTDP-4-amino-4,6-dideoxygalactose transaminase